MSDICTQLLMGLHEGFDAISRMVERFRQTPDRVVGFGGRSRAEFSGSEVIYGRFDPAKPQCNVQRYSAAQEKQEGHHPQRWLDWQGGWI